MQALRAEVARARGQAAASTLLDMSKCYERIRHLVIVEAAKREGFNLRILRVCLAIYAGPRVLSVDGAVSERFAIGTSIVAGCALSTSLSRGFLLQALRDAEHFSRDLSDAGAAMIKVNQHIDDKSNYVDYWGYG